MYPGFGINRGIKSPATNPGLYGFTAPRSDVQTPHDHNDPDDLDLIPYHLHHRRLLGQRVHSYGKSNPIGQQKDPITAILQAAAMKNGAVKNYAEGDIVFVNKGLQDGLRHTALNIPYMNAIMEEACIIKKGSYVGEKRSYEAMKKVDQLKVTNSDRQEMYCTTASEFADKWQYTGPIWNVTGAMGDKDRMFNIIFARAAKVPNLWGEVEPGDEVGLVVKEITNPYAMRYGPLGEVISPPTQGKILQIVPHATRYRKYPPHFTSAAQNSSNPADWVRDSDISFIKTQAFSNQKLYRVHETYDLERGIYPGMIDLDSGPVENDVYKRTVAEIVDSGLYMRVGLVTEVNNSVPPSKSEIDQALRNPAAYRALIAKNKLEVSV